MNGEPSKLSDDEARKLARSRVRVGGMELATIDEDARIVRLDDPDAPGVAVEAWVYLMDKKGT